MLSRLSNVIQRHLSVTARLLLAEGKDSGRPFSRPNRHPFEKDRLKRPDVLRAKVAPRNEDFFNEADREFKPRRGIGSTRTFARKEEFRRNLEADAGLDEDANEMEVPRDRHHVQQTLEEKVRRQRKIMFSEMDRRKYYGFPIEDNLLAWNAKDQIFQLRRSDPETWTPERIAESFPISTEGVRRLLKRKWPPAPTGEDENEVIRKHDDEVKRRWTLLKQGKTEDGLVSETTLRMIRSGQVKFLPMFAAGNSKLTDGTDQQQKIDEFSSLILPGDGPFVKLYKRHLQFLEKTESTSSPVSLVSSNPGASSTLASLEKTERGGMEKTRDSEDVLRAFVFPDEEPGTENTHMQLDQFRRQLEKALARRDRPEDRKYRDWMKRNEPRKSDSGSGS